MKHNRTARGAWVYAGQTMDTHAPAAAPYSDGRLHARPGQPCSLPPLAVGLHTLTFPQGRHALFLAPESPGHALPLLVLLHGATGLQGGADHLALTLATRLGAAVLVPHAAGVTWDVLRGGYGVDLEFIDRLLVWTLHRYPIAADAISLAGFSDGASYALSVGLMNGQLFSNILAFSPGFMRPLRQIGQPRIFLCHGSGDTILPVARSRDLADQLADAGYDVLYNEFDGPHTVPAEVAGPALQKVLRLA